MREMGPGELNPPRERGSQSPAETDFCGGGAASLRGRLKELPPHDFSFREALAALVPLLRSHRRRSGQPVHCSGRAELDRVLNGATSADELVLLELKDTLRTLVRGAAEAEEREAHAARADRLLAQVAPQVVDGLVRVAVTGLPPDLDPATWEALVGAPQGQALALPGLEARRLHHRLDGLVLAGHRARVLVDLRIGEVLPTLPREQRFDRGAHESAAPWLRHLDDEGRLSLTPRAIAERQAAWITADTVIDATAGCGGNTIALGLAGKRVLAIERDPQRLTLCRRNLEETGLSKRVQLYAGDHARLLPELLTRHPAAAVLLDPPWGGRDQTALQWSDLFSDPPEMARILGAASELLLKLPRAFDVSSLPARAGCWSLRYERGEPGTPAARIVKMLSARSVRHGDHLVGPRRSPV